MRQEQNTKTKQKQHKKRKEKKKKQKKKRKVVNTKNQKGKHILGGRGWRGALVYSCQN